MEMDAAGQQQRDSLASRMGLEPGWNQVLTRSSKPVPWVTHLVTSLLVAIQTDKIRYLTAYLDDEGGLVYAFTDAVLAVAQVSPPDEKHREFTVTSYPRQRPNAIEVAAEISPWLKWPEYEWPGHVTYTVHFDDITVRLPARDHARQTERDDELATLMSTLRNNMLTGPTQP